MKQKTVNVPHYEKLCTSKVKIYSPLEIYDDLFLVNPNGDILKLKDCDPQEELLVNLLLNLINILFHKERISFRRVALKYSI